MKCCEGITLVMVLSIIIGYSEAAKKAVPANCQPWRVPVAVDAPNHNNRPFYVELHRCMGQCDNHSPLKCECVPQTTQDISLQVTTQGGLATQVFKNHTSCKSQCKADYKAECLLKGHTWKEDSCSCSCPNPPAGTCTAKTNSWNTNKCQCECSGTIPRSCPPNKFWNKSICGCQCSMKAFTRCSNIGRATDMNTCRCKRPNPVANQVASSKSNETETKYVISLVATGLLLGMLLVIDLFLMCKHKGLIYSLTMACRAKKENEGYLNKAEGETGSIMNLAMNGNNKQHAKQDPITDV